jgi:hypothetical protein
MGAERRILSSSIVVVLLLAACAADPLASPSPAAGPPSPSPTAASSASVTANPSPTEAPTPDHAPPVALPEIGRPFDVTDILNAMRTSRRPGGVPLQLQTQAVAGQVAEAIWTYEGQPWETMSAGGSCGPTICSLEIAGTRPDAAGEDLWVFEIAGGELEVVAAELRALPAALVASLDEVARSLEPLIGERGLALTNARWLTPAPDGRFRLSYRSGGEEGSCRVEVTIEVLEGTLLDSDATDC